MFVIACLQISVTSWVISRIYCD